MKENETPKFFTNQIYALYIVLILTGMQLIYFAKILRAQRIRLNHIGKLNGLYKKGFLSVGFINLIQVFYRITSL